VETQIEHKPYLGLRKGIPVENVHNLLMYSDLNLFLSFNLQMVKMVLLAMAHMNMKPSTTVEDKQMHLNITSIDTESILCRLPRSKLVINLNFPTSQSTETIGSERPHHNNSQLTYGATEHKTRHNEKYHNRVTKYTQSCALQIYITLSLETHQG
jgi:hypothetical protein